MSFRICNGHRGWFCQDGIRSQRRLATQLKGEHSSSEKETLYCGNMGQVPLVAFSTFFSVKGAQDQPFSSVLGPPQSPSVGGSRIPWYHWSLTSLGFVSLLSLTVVKITSCWTFFDHWTPFSSWNVNKFDQENWTHDMVSRQVRAQELIFYLWT